MLFIMRIFCYFSKQLVDITTSICYNIVVITTRRGKEMQERFKEFTLLVANLNRCIYKLKTEEVAEFNLKSSHVSCLYYLYKEETLTAKELCDICGEDKANISRAIKYLEQNGFIFCEAKMPKRYKSPLILTEKGRETAMHIVEKIDNVLRYASEGLSEEHRQIMYQSLNLVNNNLNKLCNSNESELLNKSLKR